jgi:hypothetical protein
VNCYVARPSMLCCGECRRITENKPSSVAIGRLPTAWMRSFDQDLPKAATRRGRSAELCTVSLMSRRWPLARHRSTVPWSATPAHVSQFFQSALNGCFGRTHCRTHRVEVGSKRLARRIRRDRTLSYPAGLASFLVSRRLPRPSFSAQVPRHRHGCCGLGSGKLKAARMWIW